jgi:YesN/AraC family two-component response regulator
MGDQQLTASVFDKREEQWLHIPYNEELNLLEMVKRGEVEKISGLLGKSFPVHNGHLSDDPHRQAIYEFVACTTLVTRFAVEGGVAVEQAYTLSDAYIKSADKTKDARAVYALYEKMIIDFTTKTRRAKQAKKPFSLTVAKCMAYIDGHLHSRITLDDIGRSVGRNPAYLCVQFKEETGIPLSKYINMEKIDEAKLLLRDTNMSVSEISATLGYGSQSYFAKIFQAFAGDTPKRYRLRQAVEHK